MFQNTRLYAITKRISELDEDLVWLSIVDKDEFSEQFVRWIQEQLQEGKDGNNVGMGFYSNSGRKDYGAIYNQGDPYDLKNTGQFYNSMFLVAMKNKLILEADAEKDDENLYTKYGQAITKLNNENFEKLKEEVRNGYILFIKQILQNA
jgi:hypothetical protein